MIEGYHFGRFIYAVRMRQPEKAQEILDKGSIRDAENLLLCEAGLSHLKWMKKTECIGIDNFQTALQLYAGYKGPRKDLLQMYMAMNARLREGKCLTYNEIRQRFLDRKKPLTYKWLPALLVDIENTPVEFHK